MKKVCIIGIQGRMGKIIAELVDRDSELELVGGVDLASGEIFGKSVETDIKNFLRNTDVFVDFSNRDATLKFLPLISKTGTPVVIGTTGFSEQEMNMITACSRKSPVFISPNMSVGVNLLFEVVKKVTRALRDYDIEIIETHHRRKKDSPSGTARRIAEIISKELDSEYAELVTFRSEGITGPRKKNQIGISVVRGGEVVGEHTILFLSDYERLEITHRAMSRAVFAQGTLRAVKFIVGKPIGLYSMKDVLKTLNPKS